MSIATPRSRIVGNVFNFNSSPLYDTQLNFGAIALSTVIDVDIQCKTSTGASNEVIKLYASTSSSSIVGAVQLATYTVPTGSSQSGRFIRRLRGWNYEYDSEGETYGGNWIETLDTSFSSLNDFSPSSALGYVSIGDANSGVYYSYLIAKVINPQSVGFSSWVVEYGY